MGYGLCGTVHAHTVSITILGFQPHPRNQITKQPLVLLILVLTLANCKVNFVISVVNSFLCGDLKHRRCAKVNCIGNNGATLNVHILSVHFSHRTRCSFLVFQIGEIVDLFIHFYDARQALFDKNTHGCCRVVAQALSCVLWSNKLNKKKVAGGQNAFYGSMYLAFFPVLFLLKCCFNFICAL